MSRDLETAIAKLQELLPYVARDDERYRNPTELVQKSREFHMAAKAIEETLPHPSLARGPVIRVKIGKNAVSAYSVRNLPYDHQEALPADMQAGEEHDLRFRFSVPTDTLNPRHLQPIYGQMKYLNLATLSHTLEDGGELSVSE